MIEPMIEFTGRVGYVTGTGSGPFYALVHQIAGNHPQPWVNPNPFLRERRFSDSDVTDVTDTQELFVGEQVYYRRRLLFGTVQRATLLNTLSWLYTVQFIDCEMLLPALDLERLTVRVGDFITGRHVTSGIRYRGCVDEVLPPSRLYPDKVLFQLKVSGACQVGSQPTEPIVTFHDFVYPLVGE